MIKRRVFASLSIAMISALGLISGASAHPPSSHLHSGEFCTKRLQHWYHEHGYTRKRASDGRLRLFEW